jgi:hypothetical protein
VLRDKTFYNHAQPEAPTDLLILKPLLDPGGGFRSQQPFRNRAPRFTLNVTHWCGRFETGFKSETAVSNGYIFITVTPVNYIQGKPLDHEVPWEWN